LANMICSFVDIMFLLIIIVMFRKELQNGSTIITLPAYLTHLSGKMITCELITLPAILHLRQNERNVITVISYCYEARQM